MALRDRLATTVVGVDGGPAGWSALAWAAEHVAGAGGRLLVCRTWPGPGPGVPAGPSPSMAALELADPALVRAVTALRRRLGGHRVAVAVRVGDPVRGLIEVASGASLVVVGDDHPVAASPLSGPGCPVVVLRSAAPDGAAAVAGGAAVVDDAAPLVAG